MFRFEDTYYFYLLLGLIPLVFLLFYFEKTRKVILDKLIDNQLLKTLISDYNPKYQYFKNILIIIALFFAILALSNPQFSNKREKMKSSSSDIFIALDVSQSMLSEDISPNRLEKTKREIGDLINKNKGNRIGLIFFAGEAFLKMPLTLDYSAALMFVKTASPDQIENQGTDITEAIKICENSLSKDDNSQKALIIFSDGEDHEGATVQEAESAHKLGINIFTVAVGTEAGGFIPYTNEFGSETYKKDDEGKYIRSKVNTKLLNELAEKGGGYFYNISDKDLIGNINKRLEKLEKKEIVQQSFTNYKSYYEYLLIFSIIMLILYFILPQKKLKK